MSQLYAHEVNNLLTQISARAQLALMRPEDPELAELALQAVGDCCERINHLTLIFLTPTGITSDADHSAAPTQRATISTIHARVVGSIRETDRARYGFKLIDDTQGHAPDLMPLLLEQVLLNLMLNALRAIDEHESPTSDGHHIRIHAALEQPAGACSTWNTPTMLIRVEDTGVGMTASQITQLMNGLQVKTNHAASGDHLARHGLGMRVCRKLLDTVGGQLRCESTPMQGTRMSITIPAVRINAEKTRVAA